MIDSFDIILLLLCLIVILRGLCKIQHIIKSAPKEDVNKNYVRGLLNIFLQQKLSKSRVSWVFHLFLTIGLLSYIVIIILSNVDLVLSPKAAQILSLALDCLGASMIVSCLYFLGKNIKGKKITFMKILPLTLLFLVCVSGFVVEGSRLKLTNEGYSEAPIGTIFSSLVPSSYPFMKVALRIHFILVLLFLVAIPYTTLRHIVYGLLISMHRRKDDFRAFDSNNGLYYLKSFSKLSDIQTIEIFSCVECRRCDSVCPGYLGGKNLSPYGIVTGLSDEILHNNAESCLVKVSERWDVYSCTTCMHCKEVCPLEVNPVNKIIDIRRKYFLDKGATNIHVANLFSNLDEIGNPFGKGLDKKLFYDPKIKRNTNNYEVIVWPGCFGLFHPSYIQITKYLCAFLETMGKRYLLLEEALCCGIPARDSGNDILFNKIALRNIKFLNTINAYELITPCPHCQYAFVKYYRELGLEMNVIHISEYLWKEIDHSKIFNYPVEWTISIHDPCYLFRSLKKGGFLRLLLKRIEGLKIVELKKREGDTFCCGGGGGNMWIRTEGPNINLLRCNEVREIAPEVVITSCPYCKVMLEDSLSSIPSEKLIKVKDLMELIAKASGIILE